MVATAPPTTATLTIDGQQVTVPRGTLVVEAARQIGIDIPVFCYHPKLSLVGACRMCSCEIQMPPPPGQQPRPPGILTACTTQVADGMVVNTTGPLALKHREAVIEFLLINHPLDCPVCDAGGECPLQDNSHDWGPAESRYEEEKRHARKAYPLSELVTLDQERCIVCFRCTRFMSEVAGEQELEFFRRGWHSELRTIRGEPLRSKFQGNIIELCPCGALTSSTYRFKARPADLTHADSICGQCPVGCNLRLDVRRDELVRVRARENEAVNEIWLCDKGRFAFHYASSEERLLTPLLRRPSDAATGRRGDAATGPEPEVAAALEVASWDEALGYVAHRLKEIKAQYGPQAIAAIGGGRTTNEDNYAFRGVFRDVVGTPHVDYRLGATQPPTPLARFGLSGMTSTLQQVEQAGAILILGADVDEELPVFWLRIRKAAIRGAKLLVANPRATQADRIAFRRLRYRPGTEVALLNGLAAAVLEQDLADRGFLAEHADGLAALQEALRDFGPEQAAAITGVPPDTLRAAAAAFAQAPSGMILGGARFDRHPQSEEIAAAVLNLALLTGNLGRPGAGVGFLVERANGRGAELAGVIPGEGGLSGGSIIAAAAEGKIKALYVMGENPLLNHPDAAEARRAVANLELLVVQDLFITETAQAAHVVLPALSWAEKDGTFTNVEGRLQRLNWGLHPRGGRADWRILSDLAGALGEPLGYASADEITMDLLREVPAYAEAVGTAMPAEGMLARTNGVFHERRLPLTPVAYRSVIEDTAGEEYAFTLLSNSLIIGDERLVRQTRELAAVIPEPYVDVNREDAARLGIEDGQMVRVISRRGGVPRRARVNGIVPPGVVYAPDNLGRPRINEVLDSRQVFTRVRLETGQLVD